MNNVEFAEVEIMDTTSFRRHNHALILPAYSKIYSGVLSVELRYHRRTEWCIKDLSRVAKAISMTANLK